MKKFEKMYYLVELITDFRSYLTVQHLFLFAKTKTDFQNLLAQEKAPFEVLGAGANILQQLSPQTVGQQTTAPMATSNPFAQAAGIIGTGVGLKNLIG